MALRYQSAPASGSALSRRNVGAQRSGGFVSTTGCFIAGIVVFATVVLLGLHYSTSIESFLQQPSKFTSIYISSGVDPALLAQLGDTPSTESESEPDGFTYGSLLIGKKASKLNDKSGSGEENEEESEEGNGLEGYGYEVGASKQDKAGAGDYNAYGYGTEEIVVSKPGKSKQAKDNVKAPEEAEESYGYVEEEASEADKEHGEAMKPAEKGDVTSNSLRGANKGKPGKKEKQMAADNQLTKPKKGKRPKDPYNYVVEIDPDWGVPGKWDLKYIQVMPTKKPMIKKDRRIVLPNSSYLQSVSVAASREPPTGVYGQPRALLDANKVLERHPLYQNKAFDKYKHSLEDVMYYIKNSPTCTQQPVYITLATVGDDLYWQLIENFVYSLVKFEVSDCSLVVCVSDLKCMQMCDDAKFPCFNYASDEKPLPSVMEQIAQVKLLHVPKALSRGVDVFMLDLDVGFLHSPKLMVEAFVATPIVDIFVQEDYIFLMNRTKAGWGTWFTEPLPNIGLFLCRGNNRTSRVFDLAWGKYLTMKDPIEKSQPGKDQNHVLDSMRIGRGIFGLKYAYFSPEMTPLLDKLVIREGHTMELGGEAIQGYLDDKRSLAMHTTCYEKSTKVMGLKAANAFWNPRYYDPLTPTITKQLLYISDEQLLDEVRSLVWLAITTERSLILPNILGDEKNGVFESYKGQVMWPGFRVTLFKRSKGRNDLKVQVLEPAYYWRMNRDYAAMPEAKVVFFDPADHNLVHIRDKVNAFTDPRVVLHPINPKSSMPAAVLAEEVKVWANDSVGVFKEPFSTLKRTYQRVPSVKDIRNVKGIELVQEVLQGMRNCNNIFGKPMGTRTCFQVCD